MIESQRELAAQLQISANAISEAILRGLLTFKRHRKVRCWRFGDAVNGCLRRIDGQPFKIHGECVKAVDETKGQAWHRLIGLDDVVANDRRQILLMPSPSFCRCGRYACGYRSSHRTRLCDKAHSAGP